MDWAPWFLWAGLALNVAGTAWGLVVLALGYRHVKGHHLGQPTWHAFTARLVRLILWRRRPVSAQIYGVTGTVNATSSGSLTVRGVPGGDTERLVTWLVDEVGRLHDQVVAVDRTRASDVKALQEALEGVRQEAADDVKGLGARVDDVVTDSVPAQVWCLVLIGVGTIVGAWPSVANW